MTDGQTTHPLNTTANPTEADAQSRHADGAPSTPAPSAASPKEVDEGIFHRVEFRVHVSMRYHRARRAWWTGLNRASTAAAALAGSTALIAVIGDGSTVAAIISIASGLFAALNAAFGFPDRIREHTDLHRQFAEVASKMAVALARDDVSGRRFEAEVLLIEATEPSTIETLNVICHNQECEARAITDPCHKYKVYWINRVLKSFGTVIDEFPSEDEYARRPKGLRAKLSRWWTG